MKIILFGAPGCGKGSQATLIKQEFKIPHISTGDILRDNIARRTELGIVAEKFINEGKLVPDELVINLVKDRISKKDCKKGYILDGFPRTLEQAKQLLDFADIDFAINIDMNIIDVERRALTRRICPNCHKIFSIAEKYVENCDLCGEKLIQRDDDKLEVVRKRISSFLSTNEELIKFFKSNKILATVISRSTPEETYAELRKILLTVDKKRK